MVVVDGRARAWGESQGLGASIPHICTVRSDRDNSTATVRVDGAGPIPSRVVTLADSADVFNRGQYILGECKPER